MLQSSHVLLLPAVNGLPPELILVSCSAKSATSLHVVPHADRTDRKPAFFTAVCLPRTVGKRYIHIHRHPTFLQIWE